MSVLCHPPILSTGTLFAAHRYWQLLCVPPSLGILSFRTVFYFASYVVLSDVDVHISFVGLSLLTYR